MTPHPESPRPAEGIAEAVEESATASNATGRLPQSLDSGTPPPANGEGSRATAAPTKETTAPKAATTPPRPTYPKRSSDARKSPSFAMGILLGLLTGLLLTAIAAVVLFIGFRQDARATQLRAQEAEQRVTDLRSEVDALRGDLADIEARAERLEALPARVDEVAQSGEAMGERLDEMGETMSAMGSQVEAMGESVGGMERRLGTLQERTQAFDAFMLGLRDLSLRANPLPESAAPASPTLTIAPDTIRQGEELLITAEALEPSLRYDIALINAQGEATLLGQVQSSARGMLRFQLRGNESLDITPGRYTIALYPENDAEPVANGELRVSAR